MTRIRSTVDPFISFVFGLEYWIGYDGVEPQTKMNAPRKKEMGRYLYLEVYNISYGWANNTYRYIHTHKPEEAAEVSFGLTPCWYSHEEFWWRMKYRYRYERVDKAVYPTRILLEESTRKMLDYSTHKQIGWNGQRHGRRKREKSQAKTDTRINDARRIMCG